MEPVWLDEHDARLLHDRLLARHGGAPGIRDEGGLKSAVEGPRHHAIYSEETSLTHLAAIYTGAILRNHPFVDGNKRTGFLLGVLFLELNGLRFTARQEDAANAVIALASGVMKEETYAAFLRDNAASHE